MLGRSYPRHQAPAAFSALAHPQQPFFSRILPLRALQPAAKQNIIASPKQNTIHSRRHHLTQSNMDQTWAPPRRLIARNLTERTTTPLRPWPTPAKLTPIRPPPPSYVQQTHVPWTKRDDRRLEEDTWSYIRCEMNALEEERINPLRSFIRVVPVTDQRHWNGLGDREHQRQEHGAGQQAASHQGARPQQMAQPQKLQQQQQMEQPEQV